MSKRILAPVLAMALAVALATVGCGQKLPAAPVDPGGPALKPGASLAQVVDQVTAQYPVPMAIPLDEQLLTQLLDLSPADVRDYAGVMSMEMISADHFFALQAAPGKIDTLRQALEARLEEVRQAFEEYLPLPRAKAKAGKVLVLGEYAFLLILGEQEVEDLAAHDFPGEVATAEALIRSFFDEMQSGT